MKGKKKQEKGATDFEVYCYESDEGASCLEFGEANVSFSKKRFIEFADKLNEVRQQVLKEYLLQRQSSPQFMVSSAYHI